MLGREEMGQQNGTPQCLSSGEKYWGLWSTRANPNSLDQLMVKWPLVLTCNLHIQVCALHSMNIYFLTAVHSHVTSTRLPLCKGSLIPRCIMPK